MGHLGRCRARETLAFASGWKVSVLSGGLLVPSTWEFFWESGRDVLCAMAGFLAGVEGNAETLGSAWLAAAV